MESMVETLFWKGRRVLVTGVTGLVGSWLTHDLIAQGSSVVAFVHHPDPQSQFYATGLDKHTSVVLGDLEDYGRIEQAINKFEVETVIHLGAQAIVGVAQRSPLATFEANIRGTYNLLEACRVHGKLVKRVVVASSDKAYGTQPVLPYTEDMPLAGLHPYEVSKSCADLISQTYAHSYGLPVAIARCGNIYGGGDLNWSRIIPETIRACLRGQAPQIRSDGSFVRDYIYVKDVVSAYMRLAERMDDERVRGQGFNFSPFQPLSVLELVANIQRLMDCEDRRPQILNTAQGEIHSQYLDSTKARTLLGWQPSYDLDAGLTETIAWYRAYLGAQAEPASG